MTLSLADGAALEQSPAPGENENIGELIAALRRPLRVLLAEDNLTNQLVVGKLLSDLDIELRVAGNGVEALAAATQGEFDAIFMDMRMPEMDGLEATRAIRARGGALASVPIIALTANAFPDDIRACRDAGMTDFVAKPIRKTLLVKALTKVVAALVPDAARDSGEESGPAATPKSAPVQPAREGALIDPEVTAELHDELGAEGMAHLMGVFRQETERRIARLRELSCDHEREEIEMQAHTLKSAAALVGFARLSQLSTRLEREAQAIAPADCAALVDEMAASFEGGCRAVDSGTPATA